MAETTANGLCFHYQSLGAGRGDERLVVFLHGLVMDNLSSWYFTVANPVATRTEVLLYDLRGHGKTERPKTGYAVSDHVDDLTALLDALELSDRPLELVGNSFGGILAMAFAALAVWATAVADAWRNRERQLPWLIALVATLPVPLLAVGVAIAHHVLHRRNPT